MAEEPKKSVIASQFTGLPMKALIGGPLKAAADANAMMAKAQADFLLSYCFTVAGDKSKLQPKMVRFTIERNVVDSKGNVETTPLTMDFAVPLMTLIPISSLAIKTLEVSFDMEVKSSKEYKKEDSSNNTSSSKSTKNTKSYSFDTELHGTLSKKSDASAARQSSADYQVKLTAGELPLPNGVTAIIDMFSKSIAPIPSKPEDEKTDQDKPG